MIIVLLLFAAIAILAWGYSKAKPFGKLGILAWLQTVVLMGPWLLFFGLSATGIYLNLAGILFIVVAATGIYIYLGKALRAEGQKELTAGEAQAKATAIVTEQSAAKPVATETIATGLATDTVATDTVATDTVAPPSQSSASSSTNSSTENPPKAQSNEHPKTESENKKDEKDEARPPIPTEDLAIIEGIFGIDTFFRTQTVPFQEGAIFKGNLRGKPDIAAKTLSNKLTEKLGDRYRSFLIADPEDKPVVVVLPKENGPKPTSVGQRVLAVALAIAAIATTLETAAILQSFDIFQSPERWPEVLPIGLGLMAVLGVHELGHIALAQQRNVNISPPFLLPAWQLGAFGAITRFESILKNRTVLFDVAAAGPAAGGLLSFIFLLLGLLLSHPGSLFQLPAGFFKGSIFVGTLSRLILGGDILQGDLVDVHPLFIIGWIGLIITAINLLPAGQLDGGRMIQAIYGRKTLIKSTTITLVLLAIVGLFNPLALYWAVLIVFLQRQPERPCTDDLSEPNDARAAWTLSALLLMLLVLLPLTPSLAGRIGIG
ncbi:MAG: site-2 protease family protein [Cyanobacteria bacterium J06598_1]